MRNVHQPLQHTAVFDGCSNPDSGRLYSPTVRALGRAVKQQVKQWVKQGQGDVRLMITNTCTQLVPMAITCACASCIVQ